MENKSSEMTRRSFVDYFFGGGVLALYRDDFKHIWCACHNGHFDLTGRNIAGPPPRPLEEYRVEIRGEDVVVIRKA